MGEPRPMSESGALRIAIFQKRLAEFRTPIFDRIASDPNIDLTVVVGFRPTTGGLVFNTRILRSSTVSVFGRPVILQRGLLSEARKHDVIIVEGSIRFLTSLALVAARPFHRVPLLWWTSLHEPKISNVEFPRGFKGWVACRVFARVDGIVTYSETAASLIRNAMPSLEHLVVAPNVLDTDLLLTVQERWQSDPKQLENFAIAWDIAGRPVILFVGRLIRRSAYPSFSVRSNTCGFVYTSSTQCSS